MNRSLVSLFTLAAVLLMPCSSHAQSAKQGQFSLHVGASLPQGEFAATESIDDGSGFASTGLTAIAEYTYPLGTPGLGLIGSIALIGNGFDAEAGIDRENLEDLEDQGVDVDVSSGYWINVPLMGGLKYETEASPTLDVYGLVKAGVNASRKPDLEIDLAIEQETADITESYDTATSLGFGVGAGAVFKNQISVSLRYLRLGEAEIVSETEVVGFQGNTTTLDEDYDQSLSVVQLVVGLTL